MKASSENPRDALASRPDGAVLAAMFPDESKLTLPHPEHAEVGFGELDEAKSMDELASEFSSRILVIAEGAKDRAPEELSGEERFAIFWLAKAPVEQWNDPEAPLGELRFRIRPDVLRDFRIAKRDGVFFLERKLGLSAPPAG